MEKNTLDWIALVFVIIGSLNWGFVLWFNFNLVAVIFPSMILLQNIVYTLIGLSALYMIYFVTKK